MSDVSPLCRRYFPALVIGLSAILFVIAVTPIWLVRIPPLVDYPNHLARMHVLASGDRSPWLAEYYEIHWAVLPNLGMDAVVPPLARRLSVETAGKVFLALTLLLLAGGTIALHAVLHRRWSLWPLLAFFFLYNSVFLWGFLNYLWGLALAIWSYAAWIAWRRGPAWFVIPLFSVFGTAIFFSHLFAIGLYGIFIVGYELGEYWRAGNRDLRSALRQAAIAAAPFIVPGALLLMSPLFQTNPEDIPSWLKASPNPHGIEFANPVTILEGFKGLLRTEHVTLDRLTVLVLGGLCLAGLVTRRLSVASSMYWPLLLVTLATWLMPTNLFTGSYTEIRLPIALILLAIASTDLHLSKPGWAAAVGTVLFVFFLLRMTVIGAHWQQADIRYSEFLRALHAMPQGSRLFTAIRKRDFYSPAEFRMPSPIPTENLACWAVITNNALVSVIFSAPNQQPLRLAQPYRRYYSTGEFLAGPGTINWDAVLRDYQFLLVRRDEVLRPPIPAAVVPAFTGEHFTLYRWSG